MTDTYEVSVPFGAQNVEALTVETTDGITVEYSEPLRAYDATKMRPPIVEFGERTVTDETSEVDDGA